jgi:alpha-galactosidase
MGWNSYNCYGSAVHENEVKSNADYMAAKLKAHGWQYIVVDFLWSYANPPISRIGNPYQKQLQDGSYVPWLAMDKWGRLLPDPGKFPSSFPSKGFLPLAKYIHDKGLKFGIHVMRGIPRQAVFAKTPVKGAPGVTADMIADTASTCAWMNHMYGLDMSRKGAQEYLNSLLDLYASWGVDFIKVDDISRPYHKEEIEGYQQAIVHCGRPVVLSISPGATPVAEAGHVSTQANMWRMADDFWDNWKEILAMMKYAQQWQGKGGPGHWPDCDMLQIGKLSKRGPVGPERYSRFSNDELYTHMTFWCLYRSPLMIGGNLPENRAIEDSLFTNEEVLEVNQKGSDPTLLAADRETAIWYSHAPGDHAVFVALFNLTDAARDISVDLSQLGYTGKTTVKDLWKKKTLGAYQKQFTALVNAHGTVLLKITRTATTASLSSATH